MQLFPGAKRGYLPLFDDASMSDEPLSQTTVTPEEQQAILQEVGSTVGGTLSRVGDLLALPDDMFRGLAVGSPGERVTGRDLLRRAGLAGPEDTWGNFGAGLVADIFTSPTSYLSGPSKALTKAGKALKKADLMDSVATAASRKLIDGGLDPAKLPMVARRNLDALRSTGRNITKFDPALHGRPLVGKRTALRNMSLDDVIKYSDNPDEAAASLRSVLGDDFDALRGEVGLSKTAGFGLPLSEPFAVGDVFGKKFGDNYADVLDTAGSWYRWTPMGRLQASAFDNKVGSALDPEEQLTNIANFKARERLGGIATGAHTYQLSKLASQHPEVFQSEEANRRLGRYIEGWKASQEGLPSVMTAEDKAFVESRPGLKEYADWWLSNSQEYLDQSKRAGLAANELQDKYGIGYLPRRAEPILEMQGKADRKVGQALSAMTGDMMGRTEAMQVPGGRDTIIDLSRDPFVSGPTRAAANDESAADYLLKKLNSMLQPGQPPVERAQAIRLARVLNTLPKEVVQKSPLFGQHPTEMIGSYMRGRNQAIGTANTLYDSLATMAENAKYTEVPGGRHISIQEAVNRLGLKSYDDAGFDVLDEAGDSIRPTRGASQQMRQRLAQIFGGDPDKIKLSEVSIPEEHVNRLLRARDAFETGETAGAITKYLDAYTQAWRGSILTWPARAVRDLYSGAVSNWLEGAFSIDSVRAARALMQEGPQSPQFLKVIGDIPRYSGTDGVAQFYSDLSRSGLIGATQLFEQGASVVGKGALSNLPGYTPITTGTILSELAPQTGRSWSQFAKDFGTWRSKLNPVAETRNPILRAGEQLNSLSDGINRLTGYIELMRQGYDPQAAARAMKRAHVDYSALTNFEKNYLKNIFPWYSFQSRIFREVLRQLIEQPGGRYGQMIRSTEALQNQGGDDAYTPSSIRSQFAFPIPAEWGGVTPEGGQSFFTDLDFPGFDQINMIETPGTLAGAVSGTARQLGMQLHPVYRTAAEFMTGQDLFSRRPIGESTSPIDAIGRAVTGDRSFNAPYVVDKLAEVVPFVGRPLYTARTILDDRDGSTLGQRLAKAGSNATTGFKVRTVAPEDAVSDQIAQIEESIDPYTREFKQVYIPKHLEPYVPQEVLRRQAVARALARQKREMKNKDKKKGKKKSGQSVASLFD